MHPEWGTLTAKQKWETNGRYHPKQPPTNNKERYEKNRKKKKKKVQGNMINGEMEEEKQDTSRKESSKVNDNVIVLQNARAERLR